ncbi:MAG: TniQ family protein [Stenomitos rutilans HA7619-LM2]|jgi:DNA-directed RNA polymerase subunit RPC12/RpoP|nr:TniQ family protein [Stenomitos rutilans HA7619-LM2]
MYTFDPNHPYTIVHPHAGESIASFLYRFRQAKGNRISSPSQLGAILEVGTAIKRWENLLFSGRKPQQKQVEALSKITQVEVDRLWQMFPPKGERSQPNTIRICAACCLEEPYHRIAWQLYSTAGCDRHRLRLLPRCWACEKNFSVEALLKEQKCAHCGMSFRSMVKKQKPY